MSIYTVWSQVCNDNNYNIYSTVKKILEEHIQKVSSGYHQEVELWGKFWTGRKTRAHQEDWESIPKYDANEIWRNEVMNE